MALRQVTLLLSGRVSAPLVVLSRGHRRLQRRAVRVRLPDGTVLGQGVKEQPDPFDLGTVAKERFVKNQGFIDSSASKDEVKSRETKSGKVRSGEAMSDEVRSDKPAKVSIKPADLLKEVQFQDFLAAHQKERNLLIQSKSRKYLDSRGVFVAEGARLVREALTAGLTPTAVFFSQRKLLPRLVEGGEVSLQALRFLNGLPLFRTPYKTMQLWSGLTTCPGLTGVFEVPDVSRVSPGPLPVVVVADEVRDPANLGSIIRTAAAAGVTRLVLTKGCCDPWDAKVVRAGSGAQFHLPITTRVSWDLMNNHLPNAQLVLLADIARNPDDEKTEDIDGGSASPATTPGTNMAEEDLLYTIDDAGNKVTVDENYNNPELLDTYRDTQLPVLSYSDVNIMPKSVCGDDAVVLVIGGETGLSNSAKRFAVVSAGSQVSIPLAKGVESLNAGVATGIILYELARQFHVLNRAGVE